MSAPVFVVGYTATDSGADAAALAARLATASGGRVELVTVLLDEGRGAVVPPDASYDAYVREQAAGWLDSAVSALPAGLAHATHVRYSDSFAEGLLEVATELGAAYIVVGASPGGILGRYTLGAVANELLHSSTVPVVLAPAGARNVTAPLTRITAAVGTRPGADALIEDAVSLAAATGATLRLVSLVTIDLPSGVDTGVIRLAGSTHADMVLSQARAAIDGVRDERGCLGHRVVVDERPDLHVVLRAAADAHRGDPLTHTAGEFVGHRVMHDESVRGRAGLPDISELGLHGPVHGLVEIGVLEHDERRVSAQFHRNAEHTLGRLSDELPPHPR